MFDFLKNISSTEIIIIVLILIVLFGGKALVSLGRTSGETVKELKKVKKEFTSALNDDEEDKSKK